MTPSHRYNISSTARRIILSRGRAEDMRNNRIQEVIRSKIIADLRYQPPSRALVPGRRLNRCGELI
jgi:hypothetical protein